MSKLALYASYFFGGLLILAGVADFLSYLFQRPSPWPWWGNLVMIGGGFLLLFPERLKVAIKYAVDILRRDKS